MGPVEAVRVGAKAANLVNEATTCFARPGTQAWARLGRPTSLYSMGDTIDPLRKCSGERPHPSPLPRATLLISTRNPRKLSGTQKRRSIGRTGIKTHFLPEKPLEKLGEIHD